MPLSSSTAAALVSEVRSGSFVVKRQVRASVAALPPQQERAVRAIERAFFSGRQQVALLRRPNTLESVLRLFSIAQMQEENPCGNG